MLGQVTYRPLHTSTDRHTPSCSHFRKHNNPACHFRYEHVFGEELVRTALQCITVSRYGLSEEELLQLLQLLLKDETAATASSAKESPIISAARRASVKAASRPRVVSRYRCRVLSSAVTYHD